MNKTIVVSSEEKLEKNWNQYELLFYINYIIFSEFSSASGLQRISTKIFSTTLYGSA